MIQFSSIISQYPDPNFALKYIVNDMQHLPPEGKQKTF